MRQIPRSSERHNYLISPYPICFLHGLKSIFHFRDYWHGIPEYLKDQGFLTYELKSNWRGPNKVRIIQFEDQLTEILNVHKKIHIIAHSLATVNSLELMCRPHLKGRISSVTLVSPVFGGTPWADYGAKGRKLGLNLFASINETLTKESATRALNNFVKPTDVLVTAIISNPRLDIPRARKVALQHRLLTRILRKMKLPTENDGLVPLASQRIAKSIGSIWCEFPGDHLQVVGRKPWPANEKTAHETFLEHCIFLAEHALKTSQ